MKEIGGYLEFEHCNKSMLHENFLAFNCARNCLAYLLIKKKIKKLYIPKFLCDSVLNTCRRYGVDIKYYDIDINFLPQKINIEPESWVYIVNYYGQISNDQINVVKNKYKNIIVDNVQAYFQEPINNIDTIYTCRKFFGVSDGAFLYSNIEMDATIMQDESYERMRYLLGRFERTASEFYDEYVIREDDFTRAPIMRMSKLTENILRTIDYNHVSMIRKENFEYLHNRFKQINKLYLTIPEGAYMYPLYIENGSFVRTELLKEKIYVPTLWPEVVKRNEVDSLEYNLAKNILPLPVDQRYGIGDMEYISRRIEKISEANL